MPRDGRVRDFQPRGRNVEVLNWCLKRVEEVPYEPTVRWLFYRVYQELGYSKKDYKKFINLTARARKNYWNGWTPETLSDDTREPTSHYIDPEYLQYDTVKEFFDDQLNASPLLHFEADQDPIIFVCFEAKAMTRQFKYHLKKFRIPLWPFGGDASVPYKYRLAQEIDELADKYPGKKFRVLYFGDLDPKGLEIPYNAMKDIWNWCNTEFEFERLGINESDLDIFDIPEKPEDPGKYQWEALDEKAAGEIIGRLFKYFDKAAFDKWMDKEETASRIWGGVVGDAVDRAQDELEDEDDE